MAYGQKMSEDAHGCPQVLCVMGVSGVGKSTVGRTLADQLGATFVEGDDFHPEANKQKMARGIALDDADRMPWLDRLVLETRRLRSSGQSVVLACSALKIFYRKTLLMGIGERCQIIFLYGSLDAISERMVQRRDHFMHPGLLQSQLDLLEPPTPREHAICVDTVGRSVQALTKDILRQLA